MSLFLYKNKTLKGGFKLSDRQAIIIYTLKDKSKDVVEFVRNIKDTFSVEQLCEIFNINRNRYNYLKRHGLLDWHIAKLEGYVS